MIPAVDELGLDVGKDRQRRTTSGSPTSQLQLRHPGPAGGQPRGRPGTGRLRRHDLTDRAVLSRASRRRRRRPTPRLRGRRLRPRRGARCARRPGPAAPGPGRRRTGHLGAAAKGLRGGHPLVVALLGFGLGRGVDVAGRVGDDPLAARREGGHQPGHEPVRILGIGSQVQDAQQQERGGPGDSIRGAAPAAGPVSSWSLVTGAAGRRYRRGRLRPARPAPRAGRPGS